MLDRSRRVESLAGFDRRHNGARRAKQHRVDFIEVTFIGFEYFGERRP